MSRECAIILMDSTPLIDLAQVGHLNLLLAFDLPIYIADEVYYECVHKYRDLHGTEPADSLVIKEWGASNTARVFVKETQLGRTLADARRNQTYRDAPNYGEMAASQLYDERRRFNQAQGAPPLAPVLLIYDDADVPTMQFGGRDVHFLSTYGLLVAVEKQGLISSADELWSRISIKQRGYGVQDKKHLDPRDESARGNTEAHDPGLGALEARFDALFEGMQKPASRRGAAAAFAATPDELGRAAVAAARPARKARRRSA